VVGLFAWMIRRDLGVVTVDLAVERWAEARATAFTDGVLGALTHLGDTETIVGIGIAVAGGNENVIARNRVTRSERYGIAVFPTARFVVFDPGATEPGPPWRPRGNRVFRNVATGSGRADLALATGSGKSNCFRSNAVERVLPRGLQTRTCVGVSPAGDASVASELTRPVRVMFDQTIRRRDPPWYTSMPVPAPQPNMPD